MTDTNKTPSEHLQIIQRTLQVAAGTIELLSMAVRARSGGHEAATKDALENIDQQALSSLDALEKAFADFKNSRWAQAGEIFRELQAAGDAGVDLYELHRRYMHSPAMLSWFRRTFAPMIRENGDKIFLNQPPKARE